MAVNFSYHYNPSFLVDSSFMPNTVNTHQGTPFNFTDQETSRVDHRSSKISISNNEPSVTKNYQSPETSMVVDKLENSEQVTQKVTPKRKARRARNESSLSCPQSKDSTEVRKKKQKKSSGGEQEKDNPKTEKEEQKKGPEEPPKGYVHVRARRGQATDSHSLAERVRREKISERMKMLQRLVPGCDKVTGKALILDEIINYIQSLHNQVELLSMKLATLNPRFYDLAMDLENLLVRPEKLHSIAPSSPQCSHNLKQTTTSADTTIMTTSNEYLLDDASLVSLQEQSSNVFSEDNNGRQFWDLEDQRQMFLHPFGFGNNICFLH